MQICKNTRNPPSRKLGSGRDALRSLKAIAQRSIQIFSEKISFCEPRNSLEKLALPFVRRTGSDHEVAQLPRRPRA